MVDGVQIGVISFGDESDCALSDADSPKISARVSAYLDWIYGVVNDEGQTTTQASPTIAVVEAVESTDDDLARIE